MPRPLVVRPALRVAGVAAVSLLLASGLSGCGVAGTDFHPGVAAQVGDDTISVSHIDEVASGYCGAIEGQLQGQQQVLPMHYLRGGIVGELTLVEAARQYAAEKGVEAGPTYDQKVSQLQSAVGALPQDQQDAVIEVESSSAYIGGVEAAVGKQLLKAQGATHVQSADAAKAGQQAFGTWLNEQDITIDPEFGVEIKDAQAVPVDTSVSYALGDTAKQAGADSPDQAYASSLPSSHRCG